MNRSNIEFWLPLVLAIYFLAWGIIGWNMGVNHPYGESGQFMTKTTLVLGVILLWQAVRGKRKGRK